MTPRTLRERLLDQCDLTPGMRVLDPGVGTGEFLRSLSEREPEAEMHGWDVDPDVLTVAARVAPRASLTCRSALDPYDGEPFDLVIGNPPYFQFRASPEMRSRYLTVISGRPNIFALFFQAGLQILRPGGQLAFVVPPSMNNGAYFNNLRKYVLDHSAVEYLSIHTSEQLFRGAQTPVQLLVLRRSAVDAGKHCFTRECGGSGFRRTIFAEDARLLAAEFRGRRSLFDLGYEAVTGSIVWNQHRESLRREATENTVPLIWAHCVRDTFTVDLQHRRPAFIETPRKPLAGPAIVVNRVTGAVGSGELRCAPIPDGVRFLAENHVNVIRRHGRFGPKVGWEGLFGRLRATGVSERVRMLTGNTQVSATELTHLLPI